MVEAQRVHLDDKRYPGRLRDLAGMPEWLWIQGTASLNPERSVAIVGTRSPFYKAVEIAELIEAIRYGVQHRPIVAPPIVALKQPFPFYDAWA